MAQEDKSKAITTVNRPPGVCIPWDEKKAELPQILGDEKIVRKVWEDVDGLAYMYIWHLLVSS